MAFLRATTTPAAAPGHVWHSPEDVVEVPDGLAHELLHIADQFTEVLPGDPRHPDTKRGPGRPRKTPLSE
jgi:hypothetical protein